jgi:phage tail tape-measure protein
VIRQTKSSWDRVKESIKGLMPIISAATILNFVKDLAVKVFDVQKRFQTFGAVLKTALGSTGAAQSSMKMIQDFAAKTPFSVEELTSAYVKLVNRGFRPTKEEMTKLGDLASSTGKSFDQLVEAILDAETGEFERLKGFGVKASKHGNQVIFTFKGVQYS